MAESTLSLGFTQFRQEVAHYLGWTRDSTNWSADETALLKARVNGGYRRFLFPPPIPPSRVAHTWRFLRPVTTITIWPDVAVSAGATVTGGAYVGGSTPITGAGTAEFFRSMIGATMTITGVGSFVINGYTSATVISVSGNASAAGADTYSIACESIYRLPDDFGGMIGRPTYPSSQYSVDPDGIEMTNEARIRAIKQGQGDVFDRPRIGAVRPVAGAGAAGQRWELLVYPEPGEEYVLTYQYNAIPSELDTTSAYPLGGMYHGETIMAGCLAEAEKKDRRIVGDMNADFQRLLAISVSQDQQQFAPDIYGPNLAGRPSYPFRENILVTYNGVLY